MKQMLNLIFDFIILEKPLHLVHNCVLNVMVFFKNYKIKYQIQHLFHLSSYRNHDEYKH